jgi:hypothetical protein
MIFGTSLCGRTMHDPDFLRGVGLVLQGESLKAQAYVNHNLSLGTLREKMVRSFIRHETPERYRVETGLIRLQPNHIDPRDGINSRQCDLLIYDSRRHSPFYRWEDFVVVRHEDARAVVEVKTTLNRQEFEDIVSVHQSIMAMSLRSGSPLPTFGFSLDGSTFDSFVNYVRGAIRRNELAQPDTRRLLNLPYCIAVQSRGYLGVRVPSDAGDPSGFHLIDFSRSTDAELYQPDSVLGSFLYFYQEAIQEMTNGAWGDGVSRWAQRLPVEPEGNLWIDPCGAVKSGGKWGTPVA